MSVDTIKFNGYSISLTSIKRLRPLIKMKAPNDENLNSKRRFGPISYYSQNFSTGVN